MSNSGFWKPAPVATAASSRPDQLDEVARNDDDYAVQAAFSQSRAPLAQQRLLLPIYKHKKQIIYALEVYGVVVVVGEVSAP
jgi:HrpA-like RNA helicase